MSRKYDSLYEDDDDLFSEAEVNEDEMEYQNRGMPRSQDYESFRRNQGLDNPFHNEDNLLGVASNYSYETLLADRPPPAYRSPKRLSKGESRNQQYFGKANRSQSTLLDEGGTYYEKNSDDYSKPPGTPKNVTFGNDAPEYPASAYSPRKPLMGYVDEIRGHPMEEVTFDDLFSAGPPQPVLYHGDNYAINTVQDADIDDDIDPFGDDDSLFSYTGEDTLKRGHTMKRKGTLRRNNTVKSTVTPDEDDDVIPNVNYVRTIKKAKLLNGNYVIDAPVPKPLLDLYGTRVNDFGREMTYLRYSAVTCGPSNFVKFNYNTRQSIYSPPRETEIMVCITLYNENEILLARTLKGVFENINNLTKRKNPKWGENAWKRIVVCIVCDGRMVFNERTKALLTAMGIYQEGYAKSSIDEKAVRSHVYEYSSPVGIDKINDKVHLCANNTPVQYLFCLKEKNSRKINSHRWALQAFAPLINPKIVIFIDAGTTPSTSSFFHLWKAFHDPNVAGACGELKCALGAGRNMLVNPLVAAQNFEYKVSNILDKPMEAAFGFISVLPGAFSAYRYEALLNIDGQGPLEKYFKGEFLHQNSLIEEDDDEKELKERNFQQAGLFTSNMYLAEDRILCFELVAKKNQKYVLRYVIEAKAETDVPETIDEFIMQRRRWLNGSMFAATYSIVHWTNIWKSNHSLLRKIWLQLEFYYQVVTVFVSWFSLGCFFLVFRILTANLGANQMNFDVGRYLAVIFLWLYVGCVIAAFVLSFGNTPKSARRLYQLVAGIFAVLMAYMLFAVIFLAIHTVESVVKKHKDDFLAGLLFTNGTFRDLVISLASTYVLYLIGALLYGEPSFIATCFFQYLLLSPSYINILTIYAYCNVHDVTWGTKSATNAKQLGSAKTMTKDGEQIVTVVPAEKKEMDDVYMSTLDDLRADAPPPAPVNLGKLRDDSYYHLIRTITVLAWLFTNCILIVVVLQSGALDTVTGVSETKDDKSMGGFSQPFLTVILWIVAGLAAFRFVGSCLYLLSRAMRPIKWKFRGAYHSKNKRND